MAGSGELKKKSIFPFSFLRKKHCHLCLSVYGEFEGTGCHAMRQKQDESPDGVGP